MRAGDAVWSPLTGEKALLAESRDHCAEHFEVAAGKITFVVDGRNVSSEQKTGDRRVGDVAALV